jgi:hypothetical protein
MLNPQEQEAYRLAVVAFKAELAAEAASIDFLGDIAKDHFAALIADLDPVPESKRGELLLLGAQIAIAEAILGQRKALERGISIRALLEAS